MSLRIPLVLMVLLVGGSFFGCAEPELTESEYLMEAEAALARDEARTAVIQLKSALQLNPNNASARQLLGTIYVEQEQWPSAQSEFEKAMANGADANQLVPLLAQTFYEQARHEDLLSKATPLETMSPQQRAVVHSYRSRAHASLEQRAKAQLELEVATELAPALAQTRLARITLLHSDEQFEAAATEARALLEEQPDNREAWRLLGSIEQRLGDQAAAEAAYTEAISISAAASKDYLRRALVRIGLEDYTGASEDLGETLRIAPEFTGTRYAEGLLNFRQGRFEQAQTAFEKSINAAPQNTAALFFLGLTHLAQGQLFQADQHLSEFLQAEPDSVDARVQLAQTASLLQQPDRVLQVLEPLDTDAAGQPQVLLLTADAHLQKNDASAALPYLEQAADQAFDRGGRLGLLLALSLMQAGQEGAAIDAIAGIDEPPYDYRAQLALGSYYFNSERFTEALAVMAALEKSYPENPGVHQFKGQVYLATGDSSLARASLERAWALSPELVLAGLQLAKLDMEAGAYDKARENYKQILEQDSKSVPALVGLADVAYISGDEDGYIDYLERAMEIDPSAVIPRIKLVNLYLLRRDGERALNIAREYASQFGSKPEAQAMLGMVLEGQGNYVDALVVLRRWSSLLPNSATPHLEMAKIYSKQRNRREARQALQTALTLEPNNLEVINTLATLEASLGNHAQARALAERYLSLDPDSPTGTLLRGNAYMAAERYTEAATIFAALNVEYPNTRIVLRQYRALVAAGEPEQAEDALLAWLGAHPDDALAASYLAREYLAQGDNAKALALYERLLAAGSEDPAVLNNLANLYLELNDPRAVTTARRAYQLAPDAAAVADTLGWALIKNGDLESGLKILKAATLDPSVPELRFHLAFGLWKAGDAKGARQVLQPLDISTLSVDLRLQVAQLRAELEG